MDLTEILSEGFTKRGIGQGGQAPVRYDVSQMKSITNKLFQPEWAFGRLIAPWKASIELV